MNTIQHKHVSKVMYSDLLNTSTVGALTCLVLLIIKKS